jgi:hypothetical protein
MGEDFIQGFGGKARRKGTTGKTDIYIWESNIKMYLGEK